MNFYLKLIPISLFFFFCQSCHESVKKSKKPNFIIFIADDISWDDFGCYGNKQVKTPNIDNLSSEGLIFNNMYLTTSSCSPSRNSIMTGRYPHNTGAPELHTEPPIDMVSMAEVLKDHGYYTVSSGKFHMGEYARRGFNLIHDKKEVNGKGGEKKWLNVLENRPKQKPFFMWYASYDAHRDWDNSEFSGTHNPDQLIPPEYLVNDRQTRVDLAKYYDEINRFDYSVGEVVDELKRQGVFDNTIIMIMSDNGRPFPHSKTRVNDQGVKTPFILVYKNENILGITEGLVSSIDIAPTILDYAKIEISETFQGRSFRKLLTNPRKPFRNYVFAEHNWHDYEAHQRMVRDKNFMYIENNRNHIAQLGPLDAINSLSFESLYIKNISDELNEIQKEIFINPRPKEEFYEMQNDHFQRNNLIQNEAFENQINDLKKILNIWKVETGDSEPMKLTKHWYSRKPGSKVKNDLNKSIELLKTKHHGIRGEFPGQINNAVKINHKGPF